MLLNIYFITGKKQLDYEVCKFGMQSIEVLSNKGKTQFIITHDAELAEICCDYFVFFENGNVIHSGTWTEKNIELIADYFNMA